jgi:hypothetical protein
VTDQQGVGARVARARVDEVDALAVDDGAELIEGVEPRLLGAPVEGVAPVGDQLPRVGEVGPELPAGAGDLVREAGGVEAPVQILEVFVRNRDAEGLDGVAHPAPPSAVRSPPPGYGRPR